MLARTGSVAIIGTEAHLVEVQVFSGTGIPGLSIVGLPARSVQESAHRTRAGLESSNEKWPAAKMIANLAPGQLRKEGTHFDLALALGVLAANERLPPESIEDWVVVGEVGLNGEIRPVPGVLAAAITCREHGRRGVVCPRANAPEAALVEGIRVIPVRSLTEAKGFMAGSWEPEVIEPADAQAEPTLEDMSEVRGHADAKRGAEIAAAGGHNLLLTGTPGSGKTMLARRIAGILPPMTLSESLDVTKVYSIAGLLGDRPRLVTNRPVRTPHHHVSLAGLVGGGSGLPRPGEVALANHGVLFLDELPLYPRHILEGLRGPIEDGVIRLARSHGAITFPCRFSLIAAMNPCPCGFIRDPKRLCRCSPMQLHAYRSRISGPLLDRFDMQIRMERLPSDQLMSPAEGEGSEVIRQRVESARRLQRERYGSEVLTNASAPSALLKRTLSIAPGAREMVADATERLDLTGRAVDRLQRVARTVADLVGAAEISSEHVATALLLRLDGRHEEVAA